MTRRLALLAALVALLTAPALMAGVGTESATIPAAGMPEPVSTEVLLPPGWSPGTPARLMVFLHDCFGNQHSLRRKGLAEIAVGMMERGELPATVIASPKLRGTFASDSPRGAMETFLAEHLVPDLQSGATRARAERRSGAASGGSHSAATALSSWRCATRGSTAGSPRSRRGCSRCRGKSTSPTAACSAAGCSSRCSGRAARRAGSRSTTCTGSPRRPTRPGCRRCTCGPAAKTAGSAGARAGPPVARARQRGGRRLDPRGQARLERLAGSRPRACKVFKADVRNSVVGLRSHISDGVKMYNTVMMGSDYYDPVGEPPPSNIPLGIGTDSLIDGAIQDKNVRIGKNVTIKPFPPNAELDEGDWVVKHGIVVIPKNTVLQDGTSICPD